MNEVKGKEQMKHQENKGFFSSPQQSRTYIDKSTTSLKHENIMLVPYLPGRTLRIKPQKHVFSWCDEHYINVMVVNKKVNHC